MTTFVFKYETNYILAVEYLEEENICFENVGNNTIEVYHEKTAERLAAECEEDGIEVEVIK